MAKAPKRECNPQYLQIIVNIAALELKARDLGLHETAHALNKAQQKIGWEIEVSLKRGANQ